MIFPIQTTDSWFIEQPRLVVGFADGLQLQLCDRSDIGLAAELIAAIRLTQQITPKGSTD